ncbi:ACT domain-containing protein [Artemisia annua]|uniref:ACT domain-containing protein ACR n=1 Tax=Artemisia annua TaxID=35608 RepID=A0A2U1KAZ3_ARTAN|nr:ACT domain-containing protein [Artemisia annua]
MSASMASCGFTIKVHRDLAAFASHPTCKSAVFGYSVGSNHVNNLCMTGSHKSRWSYATVIPKASATALEDDVYVETDEVPVPKVIIDQDSDLDATVVEVTFGDRLGALLDTMGALTNLGLNVVKAKVHLDSSGKHTKFAITKASTGRKVEEPELLEAIRLTIISNLLEYHPESSAHLAMGEAFGIEAPKHKVLTITPLTSLRKAYHKKSGGSDTTTRLNHDEAKNKNLHTKSAQETDVWIPDSRTGIYYPKGQEKVIEGVPAHAAKDYTVNWFSMS